MDPFTEKLLERTRARRENLQKKMTDRPNAASRAMAKRPLADTNSVSSQPAIDKAPQAASKPSPSKRRCSGEDVQSTVDEENQEPMVAQPAMATLPAPPTDKKPPVCPGSLRSSSSLEKAAARPTVQLKAAQPEPERMTVTPAPVRPSTRDAEMAPASLALQTGRRDQEEDAASSAGAMKSRLQRLAAQRKGWDESGLSGAAPEADFTPLSVSKRQAEPVPAETVPAVSSGTPLGRRGRLANLAATIGSWEDDLSHASFPCEKAKEKPSAAALMFAARDAAAAASSNPSTASPMASASSSNQAACSLGKSGRVVPPSPKKPELPTARTALNTVTSPQKGSSQGPTFPSSPHKAIPSSSSSSSQSPLKNQALSRGLNLASSPQKPELRAKPTTAGSSVAPDKATSGAPGVKSFLERFGERCQERSNHSSPAGGSSHPKTPSVTPSVTPNTRLVQERLRAAQGASTATADLTQRQKLERESELAQIRSRFQKGNNMWKSKDEAAESSKSTDVQEQSVEAEAAPRVQQDEATAPSTQRVETPTKCPISGPGLMTSPPASASSPLRAPSLTKDKTPAETPKDQEVIREIEMNVDQSINSAVINELFDGVLDDSDHEDEDDDEEEEDALNISSMSLLAPLADTVAAVVKSPERRLVTSTPASSFLIKSNTPDGASKPAKFQRTNMVRSASSDSVEASDEDHRLPYSIDAYRSTRVKETERPNIKQVIVRKEDVSHRQDEPRGSSHFNVKQRMKLLTNDMSLQQTVIHQASQALNCCTDEEHGKGSQVEAEAQRLLLVATERREAIKAELDCLKADPTGQRKKHAASEAAGLSASKGSITLQELRLPLKADFVCSTANKPEATKYSFFIMIRAGAENTVATPLASTHRGLSGDTLTFPTKFTMSDISSDFEIQIEVYGLVQKREVCTDKKKKPIKSKAITPKRFLAITKSAQTPVVASPGGPNAVRTSEFVLVGSHRLTLSSIGKNKFPLEKMKYEGELLSDLFHTKVPFLCPLEGNIYLKMQCEVGSKVEERGFLTMFEDVSGFGAWHRRWCTLSGYCISYWTYPDDEKRKHPIGRINLANCTSKRVEPANREFCARPNTFELITVRPQREDDKETLVSQCQDTMCVTKNWLSADTKDERNLWMKKLNQILVDLRMWQPDSCYRPV